MVKACENRSGFSWPHSSFELRRQFSFPPQSSLLRSRVSEPYRLCSMQSCAEACARLDQRSRPGYNLVWPGVPGIYGFHEEDLWVGKLVGGMIQHVVVLGRECTSKHDVETGKWKYFREEPEHNTLDLLYSLNPDKVSLGSFVPPPRLITL